MEPFSHDDQHQAAAGGDGGTRHVSRNYKQVR